MVKILLAKARAGGRPRNEGLERGQGFTLSQGEGFGEDVRGNDSKHVKGTKNHQLQKFAPLGLVSLVTLIYFAP